MLITVDTGGTKTLVTAFDRQGKPGDSFRFPTPKNEDDYIGTLGELIHEQYISKNKRVDALVIGTAGLIVNNKVVHSPNLGWNNFDIPKRLSGVVQDAPIWLENDANLAGLSETIRLKKQPRNSLYVTISTGIGTGVIADGVIDHNMAMSEGGHMLIEYDGKLREWEHFASGKSIKETYGKYARDIESRHVWNQIADKISRGFLVLIPMIAPDVIIIGGSIGTYYDKYIDSLKKMISKQLPDFIPMPTFYQAKHPEEAVIYGCYYYGIQQLAEKAKK
jgi:predicted NBD/HSP70 family sugar kinase